jgi:hypothetical protein
VRLTVLTDVDSTLLALYNSFAGSVISAATTLWVSSGVFVDWSVDLGSWAVPQPALTTTSAIATSRTSTPCKSFAPTCANLQ